MKVLNFLFDDRFGGAQRRVILVGEALQTHGVTTVLVLPDGDGEAPRIASERGLRCVTRDFSRIPRLSSVSRMASWLWGFRRDVGTFRGLIRAEKPDLAHVNGAFFLQPALAAYREGVPVVWHLNDMIVPYPMSLVFGRIVSRMARRIVVSSRSVSRHYGIPKADGIVIYPPVDTQKFPSSVREVLRPPPVRVAFVANWTRIKGADVFVKAMALVRDEAPVDVRLVMAGSRWDSQRTYWTRVDRLIENLGLEDITTRVGFNPQIEEVLAEVDVLVSCSLSEACPMVMLEGLAAGLPVVASDVGGVREILLADPERPGGVVVDPGSPRSLANGVLRILRDRGAGAALAGRGVELASDTFSLGECSRRHRRLYGGAA
jgi:glycosyltransferase involved in cell wall biosynthesis